MQIGKQLKELRMAQGYTQSELSEILNVSRQTISSWEVNRTYPDIGILLSLSKLYNLSLDELLEYDDNLVPSMIDTSNKIRGLKRRLLGLTFLFGVILFFLVVYFFMFTPKESDSRFSWKDYSNIFTEQHGKFYYHGEFINKLVDQNINGKQQILLQNIEDNRYFDDTVELRVMRSKDNSIKKIVVKNSKSNVTRIKEEYGGTIYSYTYDTWEQLNANLDTINHKQLKKNTQEQLIMAHEKSDGKVLTFFKLLK